MMMTLLPGCFFQMGSKAGEAGVGVLNVAPKFSEIKIVSFQKTMRLYLTISDYNSWDDVYRINVTLEYHGSQVANFQFHQYADPGSFQRINEFTEMSHGKNLLQIDRCSSTHSNKSETVEDKCELRVLFVFTKTLMTNIKITVEDREGEKAMAQVDYSTEETVGSENMLVIPWFDRSIVVKTPPYFVTLLAALLGLIGVMFYHKKKILQKREK